MRRRTGADCRALHTYATWETVMDIAIRTPGTNLALARATLEKDLGFGRLFTDLMFRMRYSDETGWRDPEIVATEPIVLDPAAMVRAMAAQVASLCEDE